MMARDWMEPIQTGFLSLTGGGEGSLALVRSMADDAEMPLPVLALGVTPRPFVPMAWARAILGPAGGIEDTHPCPGEMLGKVNGEGDGSRTVGPFLLCARNEDGSGRNPGVVIERVASFAPVTSTSSGGAEAGGTEEG